MESRPRHVGRPRFLVIIEAWGEGICPAGFLVAAAFGCGVEPSNMGVSCEVTVRASRIRSVPVPQDSAMIGGIVKPLAGDAQRDAARLEDQQRQQREQGENVFLAEHGAKIPIAAR